MKPLTLHDYQLRTVERIQSAPLGRHILNFEPGLGKTAAAIEAMRRRDIRRALIVTPALVRRAWQSELHTWWPAHPIAGAITAGRNREKGLSEKALIRKAEAYNSAFQIVSYELVKEIDDGPWDAIVLDEIHKIKDPLSIHSKAVKALCHKHKNAMILGLTGTLMPDRITDVWNPLDTIWPNGWGRPQRSGKFSWSFANRYAVGEHNGYGWNFKGINPVYADELKMRLAKYSTRVTRDEVAHLLQAFDVHLLPVKVPMEESDMEDFFSSGVSGNAKIPFAVDWVEDTLESVERCAVLTHLKATGRAIAEALQNKGIAVFYVDGEMGVDARLDAINKAKETHKAVLVATMHSVGIGIDLTSFANTLFAELYWRPETVLQALGRFSRLSGTVPSSVQILVLQGTVDEAVGLSVLRKIEAINQAIEAGAGENALEKSLAGPAQSDEQFQGELQITLTQLAARRSWDD